MTDKEKEEIKQIDQFEKAIFSKILNIIDNFNNLDCSDHFYRFEVVKKHKRVLARIFVSSGLDVIIIIDKKISIEILQVYNGKSLYRKEYSLKEGVDNYMELENLIFQFIDEC